MLVLLLAGALLSGGGSNPLNLFSPDQALAAPPGGACNPLQSGHTLPNTNPLPYNPDGSGGNGPGGDAMVNDQYSYTYWNAIMGNDQALGLGNAPPRPTTPTTP